MKIRFAVIVGAVTLLTTAHGAAAKTFVTADTQSPTATLVDGGGFTVSVGLTNITSRPVPVTVAATSQKLSRGCHVTVMGSPIPAAVDGSVTLTFDSGCSAKDANSLTLLAGRQTIELTPQDPVPPNPDWHLLWGFGFAFIGGFLLTFALGVIVKKDVKGGLWATLTKPLLGLPDTWNLGDSLVTNATVVGSTLVGVLGSTDVVKAILGPDADTAVALTTVGAAVAAGIVGLAVVVLKACQSKSGHFTLGGLLLAAIFTIAGCFGELYVIWRNGLALPLGGFQNRLWWIELLLGLLLVVYIWRSLRQTIDQGIDTKEVQAAHRHRQAVHLSTAAVSGARLAMTRADTEEPEGLHEEIRLSVAQALQAEPELADPVPALGHPPRKTALL